MRISEIKLKHFDEIPDAPYILLPITDDGHVGGHTGEWRMIVNVHPYQRREDARTLAIKHFRECLPDARLPEDVA
jgi:hypothetical protein